MDFTEQSSVILSLCTGSRGLERGLERAFQTLHWQSLVVGAYVEIEAFIVWNLVKQMEQGLLAPTPIYTDVKTFRGEFFHGKIHGIIGGYPCQPFSFAGQRNGDGDPRHLWPYISKLIESTQPIFCFFENVAGHLSMGFGEVYRSLRDLGYVVEAGIYSAEEIGAPHQRKRLFILALKMADASSKGSQECGGNRDHEKCTPIERSSEELADSDFIGSETRLSKSTKRQEGESGIINDKGNRWPAEPGQPQFDWEAPRLESRMGFSVNGYSFREDLLRMAGNAVVEQTAELAFIDLLNKHTGTKIDKL